MASKMSQKANKKPLDTRSKMYIVMGLCSLMLLVSVVISFLLIGGGDSLGGSDEESASLVDSAPLVTESGYDKDQNTIDQNQYSSTILEETEDAGQTYVDETLFLGDSNTARMYRMFDYCTYDNAIGSVGMSAKSLATYACVKLQGYSGYVTMAKAVSLMQPKRVIITFGTNDLSPSYSADAFVENYQAGIQTIVDAYPSVDIIVNAIPPLGQVHSNESLTQAQVDEYNKALVEMCQDNEWKFLNSAEALKDSATGYAKSGYVESSDGIHLTRSAMEALFEYVRTHSYITEDDRPTVQNVAVHTGEKDVVSYTTPVVSSTVSSVVSSESETTSSSTEMTPTPTEAPTQAPTEAPTQAPTQAPTEAPTPEPATPVPATPVPATPEPTPEATPVPTPEPTPQPTPEPTPEPTPAATEPPASESSSAPADSSAEPSAEDTQAQPSAEGEPQQA